MKGFREAVNPQLDAAALTLSSRLFPLGFDVGPDAPSSLESLTALLKGQRMKVYDGGSDDTIFGSPEVNYAFRAWHDWCHWRYQLSFTLQGEREAAFVQIAHLVRLYGDESDVWAMAALVLTEVIGQAEAYGSHGQFPAEQRAFTVSNVWRYFTLARHLVTTFSAIEASDKDALRIARKTRVSGCSYCLPEAA